MKTRTGLTLIAAKFTLLMFGTATLLAQSPPTSAAPPEPAIQPPAISTQGTAEQDQSAGEVRRELSRLLQEHPGSVWQVLRTDPSLMLNEEYLAAYPQLAAYLAQHPEIARDPRYFVGTANTQGGDIIETLAAMTAMFTFLGLFIWLIRTLIDYRRWSRLSRVQTEVHTKLLDRFTNSEDLRAYFESPAGRRFLESEPIDMGSIGSRTAPFSRILWSLQVGVVLALGGTALHFAIPSLAEPEAADPLRVLGTIAIGLGLGFLVSAGASYILSQRLGLLTQATRTPGREAQPR